MNILDTEISGVKIIEPKLFGDQRGYFFESYRKDIFEKHGMNAEFVQDNESFSTFGVLRGLHFQKPPYTQTKLVRVISGCVLDVVVDIRLGSPTFGKHVKVKLSGENKRQLYVPKGMAHGFAVLSETVTFVYKCDGYYAPASECTIKFDDPAIGIDWELKPEDFVLSPKDLLGVPLNDAPLSKEY